MKRANQEESILDKVTAEIRNQQVDPKIESAAADRVWARVSVAAGENIDWRRRLRYGAIRTPGAGDDHFLELFSRTGGASRRAESRSGKCSPSASKVVLPSCT